MTVPTKSYTPIADSAVDADSPLDETLVTNLRDNDVNAHEWIGGSYTAAIDHDHDGVNSALVTAVGNDTITGDMLDLTGFHLLNECYAPAEDAFTTTATPFFSFNGTKATVGTGLGGILNFVAGDNWERTNVAWFDLSNGNIVAKFRVDGNTVLNEGVAFGLASHASTDLDLQGEFIGFLVNTANSKYITRTEASGTPTDNDTSLTMDAVFHTFEIEATPTEVKFYIDGVLESTHTTNITTSALYGVYGNCTRGTSSFTDYDYSFFYQDAR